MSSWEWLQKQRGSENEAHVFWLFICILLGSIMLSKTCWKSNYLSEPPKQWGGLLSLKDTEINISALGETFPIMQATNLG